MSPLVVTEPTPLPDIEDLQEISNDAEPEQHALHVPPYSQQLRQSIGPSSALFEEPLEIPKYTGSLHQKKKLFSK